MTLVNCGPSAPLCNSNNFVTTYFRKSFQVADASLISTLTLTLLKDDGAVAYLNGTEVFRINMPAGAVGAGTLALQGVGGTGEQVFHKTDVEPALLVDGYTVTPTTILDGTLFDAGDGCVTAGCDGPYNKPTTGPAPNEGTVYAVVGFSGRNNPASGNLDHPVMAVSINDLGSMILDIEDDRLDATVINRTCATLDDPGCVIDAFTIVKGPIQAVYLELDSPVETLAPGETMPFEIELENITGQSQDFTFLLFLGPPSGATFNILQVPLTLGPLSAVSRELGLPLPAAAPLGTWTLTAVAFQAGPGIVDLESISFTVAP